MREAVREMKRLIREGSAARPGAAA